MATDILFHTKELNKETTRNLSRGQHNFITMAIFSRYQYNWKYQRKYQATLTKTVKEILILMLYFLLFFFEWPYFCFLFSCFLRIIFSLIIHREPWCVLILFCMFVGHAKHGVSLILIFKGSSSSSNCFRMLWINQSHVLCLFGSWVSGTGL